MISFGRMAVYLVSCVLVLGCDTKYDADQEGSETKKLDIVKLTTGQVAAAGITTGPIKRSPIRRSLWVNGTLAVPPQYVHVVSPPQGGFVRDIRVREGMPVKKGDLLFMLENLDYIQMQQEFLESKSQHDFLAAEFERQKALSSENINSGKSLQQAKANYERAAAVLKGLEARLRILNISPDKLSEGRILERVPVYSSINGVVSQVHLNTGQFASTAEAIVTIVDLHQMQLVLEVFEKDVSRVRLGQRVSFRVPNDTLSYGARVTLTGKEVSAERTVRIQCEVDSYPQSFVSGMYISATIDTETYDGNVLPAEAVVSYADGYVIFVVTSVENSYQMVPVTVGAINGDVVEVHVPGSVSPHAHVVISGANRLLGVLKNTGDE